MGPRHRGVDLEGLGDGLGTSARALQSLVEERARAVPKAGHVNLLRGADLSLDGIAPYLHEVAHHVGPVWVRKIASGDPLFPVIIDCFKGGNVVARRDVEQACQAKNIPFSASRFRSLIEELPSCTATSRSTTERED